MRITKGSETTKAYAKELRKAANLSEVLLWRQLKNRQFCDLKFTRQQTIGNYIVDFFCHEKKVAIEIDGISHDAKGGYDKARDEYMRRQGIKVIRINDIDVKNNLDGVLQWIKGNVGNAQNSPLS